MTEDNVCPECGKWKGEEYELCYQCNLELNGEK